MAVNWIDDISPMFTQYDVIQMKWHFDLSDYNTVKTYAQAILMAVSATHPNTVGQMPKYEDPWTQEMMNTFQEWTQEGFRYSASSPDPPPVPATDPLLPVFIVVSEILTGFDGLDQNQQLAQTYLTRLRNETANGSLLDHLLTQFEPGIGNPQQLEPDVLASTDLFTQGAQPVPTELAQQIIILWYTATIMELWLRLRHVLLEPRGLPETARCSPSLSRRRRLASRCSALRGPEQETARSNQSQCWVRR